MPEPGHDPNWPVARRTAIAALLIGLVISALKFGLFTMSNSAAVLSDALESLVNVAAAGVLLVSLVYADRPPDREHRYGHGNALYIAIAFEGAMILFAGLGVIVEAIRRLNAPQELQSVSYTIAGLVVISLFVGALGAWVYRRGQKLGNRALIADGKHLLSDLATTGGALVGLILVRLTGIVWIDSAVAIILGAVILITGWQLVGESFGGLMERADANDLAVVVEILEDEKRAGSILNFHKVRVRRTGQFPWVDMHLQVPPEMTVGKSHELASRIEGRIEQALGGGDATAHVEPGSDES